MKTSSTVQSWIMKFFTITLTLVVLFATSSLTTVLTNQKALEAASLAQLNYQQSPPAPSGNIASTPSNSHEITTKENPEGRQLPYDERAMGLLARLSEYNSFSDSDKQYIQE